MNWSRATARPELFPLVQADFVPAELTTPEISLAPELPPTTAASPAADLWYYHQLGTNYGPVDFDHLQYLAKSGQIQPEDMVWKEGLPEWIPASRVPGLIGASAAAAPISDESPFSGAELPDRFK